MVLCAQRDDGSQVFGGLRTSWSTARNFQSDNLLDGLCKICTPPPFLILLMSRLHCLMLHSSVHNCLSLFFVPVPDPSGEEPMDGICKGEVRQNLEASSSNSVWNSRGPGIFVLPYLPGCYSSRLPIFATGDSEHNSPPCGELR